MYEQLTDRACKVMQLMTLPRRRWLVAACVAGAVLALALWRLWQGPAEVRFTRAQYERVRLGMTMAEAEAAVGMPPCRRREDLAVKCAGTWINDSDADVISTERMRTVSSAEWVGDDGSYIMFLLDKPVRGREPRVIQKTFTGHTPEWQLKARAWLAWLRGLVGLLAPPGFLSFHVVSLALERNVKTARR